MRFDPYDESMVSCKGVSGSTALTSQSEDLSDTYISNMAVQCLILSGGLNNNHKNCFKHSIPPT